jgi:hypothetical protein
MFADVFARSVTSVPPLAAPSGTIVNVSTETQLQAAVASLCVEFNDRPRARHISLTKRCG